MINRIMFKSVMKQAGFYMERVELDKTTAMLGFPFKLESKLFQK